MIKMIKTGNICLALSALAALIFTPNQVSADYAICCNDNNKPIKWSNPTQTIKVTTNITGLSRSAIESTAARWSMGSGFSFNVVSDDDDTVCHSGTTDPCDGNEIGYYLTGPNEVVPARTLTTYTLCTESTDWLGNSSCSAGHIVEQDIITYANKHSGASWNWYFAMSPPRLENQTYLTQTDWSLAVSHELGHAAGLTHTDWTLSRMEDNHPCGGWFHTQTAAEFRVTPMAVDRQQMAHLYPGGSSGVDLVALNHYHEIYLPANQPQTKPLSFYYDPNDPDNNYEKGDVNLYHDVYPYNTVNRGNRWKDVLPGDTVWIRVCAQNMGSVAWNEDVPVQIRLSSDWRIDESDIETGDGHHWTPGTLGPYAYVCSFVTMTVPNILQGWYYVGYILGTGTGDANNTNMLNYQIHILPH